MSILVFARTSGSMALVCQTLGSWWGYRLGVHDCHASRGRLNLHRPCPHIRRAAQLVARLVLLICLRSPSCLELESVRGCNGSLIHPENEMNFPPSCSWMHRKSSNLLSSWLEFREQERTREISNWVTLVKSNERSYPKFVPPIVWTFLQQRNERERDFLNPNLSTNPKKTPEQSLWECERECESEEVSMDASPSSLGLYLKNRWLGTSWGDIIQRLGAVWKRWGPEAIWAGSTDPWVQPNPGWAHLSSPLAQSYTTAT